MGVKIKLTKRDSQEKSIQICLIQVLPDVGASIRKRRLRETLGLVYFYARFHEEGTMSVKECEVLVATWRGAGEGTEHGPFVRI